MSESIFVLRGAVPAENPRSGAAPSTTLKTDTVDEGDRPDVAADGMWLAPATTHLTEVRNESDKPDIATDHALTVVVTDGFAVAASHEGRSFFEAAVRRGT